MRKPRTKLKPALPKTSAPVKATSKAQVWLLALLLGLVTVVLYWPAMRHDFLNYDDQVYVTENVHVQAGLSWAGVKWAFTNPVADNWHPMTTLSHMMDCQMYGLKPWGHHLTSVLLHALNTMLVFLLLRGLTGSTWRSVVLAALFGWHPLHVESVAWVAERKDVLSTCFGLLALIFYVRYARSPIANHQSRIVNYLLALFFLALGLMSKAMLVTWPFVMLLLDYWPLNRLSGSAFNVQGSQTRNPEPGTRNLWTLVWEKIPFFVLVAAMSVVTFIVQKQGGALRMGETLSFGARLGNALVSYCLYLAKLFWPVKLAVFYPHPGYWPLGEVLLAGGLLAGLSAFFWRQWRRQPFLLMGWLWFLGTLAPVIQLIQTGEHAMADRYTYIPLLGMLVVIVWGVVELTAKWRLQKLGLAVAGLSALVLCVVLTRQQLGYWQDGETLFRHALAVTKNNVVARYNLGVALDKRGRNDEAISQYQEAIRLNPAYAEARSNLGTVFYKQGQTDKAIGQYQEAIRLDPDCVDAHNNLGTILYEQGKTDEAITQYQEAIRLKPDYIDAHYNLGLALNKQGRLDEAIGQFQETVRLNPNYIEPHFDLGNTLAQTGRLDEAISQFQEVIRLKPDYAQAHSNLGIALTTKGQVDEAIRQFQEAIRLDPNNADTRYNFGTALAQNDRLDEAISQFQEALRLKPDYTAARHNLDRALEPKNASSDAPIKSGRVTP